nr:fatty acid desaturase, type 1 [Tanacetum cinerariifolium]
MMPYTNNKGSDPGLEKKRMGGFYWFRKWNSRDVTHLFLFTQVHVLAACGPFVPSWEASWFALFLGYLAATGVTLGYHRLLTHRSFKIPKWLEYFLVYCGSLASEGDPIFWVSVHKYHHKYVDTKKDPHTPNEGFWFGYVGWLFDNDYFAAK